jgi:hypothetical protein
MQAQPQPEHDWLQQLVGEWEMEAESVTGPGQPPAKSKGFERVRSLGGLWVVCEGQGEMPGGGTANMIMTLGYDPRLRRYVGTWVGSMMTNMWVYNGTTDPAGRVLTLDTEGPDFASGGDKTARYQDVIEIVSEDHRTLTSRTPGPDGKWVEFMKAHYRKRR